MNVDGLAWLPGGHAVLSGPVLALAERVESRLAKLAAQWQAEELRVPPVVETADLERLDWLRSFPHLATLATTFDDPEAVAEGGARALAPPAAVLTPAACFHVYGHLRGQVVTRPRHLTVQATCFRREAEYRPLERQWTFTMREVVAVGAGTDVAAFLAEARTAAEGLAADLGLDVAWAAATDPFFRPPSNPRYLMQLADPTKHELRLADGLAIASVNLHHDHFGRAFAVSLAGGAPATTGCLAFGLERWLAAVIRHHGLDPDGWPQ